MGELGDIRGGIGGIYVWVRGESGGREIVISYLTAGAVYRELSIYIYIFIHLVVFLLFKIGCLHFLMVLGENSARMHMYTEIVHFPKCV